MFTTFSSKLKFHFLTVSTNVISSKEINSCYRTHDSATVSDSSVPAKGQGGERRPPVTKRDRVPAIHSLT